MHKINQKDQKALVERMFRDHKDSGAQTEQDFMRLGYTTEEIASVWKHLAQRIAEASTKAA